MSLAINPNLRRFWRTLRFRLAAWNAALVIVTALVTLLGLRQGVRWALVHELDQVLIDDAREVDLALQGNSVFGLGELQEALTRKAQGHEHRGWYVKLLADDEKVVWTSPDAWAADQRLAFSGDLLPITAGEYRIVEHRLGHPVGRVSAIRVGAGLDLIEQDMRRIDRGVLVAAGSVLAIGPLLGFWMASRAARTLGDIISTASRLRPSRLEERLPTRGSGDELDQLAHTVNGLLDRIAAYLDTKRDFLANAAHELRTPLAAIRSSIEVALNTARSSEEYQDLMLDLIEECATLETLVNQLLLISEAEADLPTSQFEAVELQPLTIKSIEMFTGVAEARQISLRSGRLDDAIVLGNRYHLRQVLNNLLDNAVKYTSPGGEVTIELVADLAADTVALTVTDTGAGIPRAEQRLIFDRFYRAESARTRTSGSKGAGLGLSICQSVVHTHGGTISCKSDPGRGSQFSVVLPLHRDHDDA